MTKMLTTTRISTIRMSVFLPPMLPPLVFLSLALFFLVLLPLALPLLVYLLLTLLSLVFLPPVLPLLVLLPPALPLLDLFTLRITTPGFLNHGFSSPLFYFLSHFYLSLFSFSCSVRSGGISHQNLDAHSRHTTSPSLFPIRVFRATLLSLEEDYAVQHSISLLETSRKQLRLDMDRVN